MSETKQNEVSSSREFLKVQDLSLLRSVGGERFLTLLDPFNWRLRGDGPATTASEPQPNIEIAK